MEEPNKNRLVKILMISTDRGVFDPNSSTRKRLSLYSSAAGQLHIIVFSLRRLDFQDIHFSENIWAYPTNSCCKLFYLLDAFKIGVGLFKKGSLPRGLSLISTQDPFECGLVGLALKLSIKLPLDVQLHTDLFSPKFVGVLNRFRKSVSNFVFKRANSVRVVGRRLVSLVSQKYGISRDLIYYLPVFIDKEKILKDVSGNLPDIKPEKNWDFTVIMASRLSPEKNVGFGIEIFADFIKKKERVGMMIIGSGREELKLKKIAEKLGVLDKIIFTGWVESPHLYFKKGNVFLQTSLFEGYGMSLVEAGLSGLPIVSTPVGVAKELESGREGLICRFDNKHCFIEALEKLFFNKDFGEYLNNNFNKTINQHVLSKEDYISALSKFWQKTLTNSGVLPVDSRRRKED